MKNNFYGHSEDTYIIKDKTNLVEIPMDLALEVYAFLANNQKSQDKVRMEISDPRFQPVYNPVMSLHEKFGHQISESYRFERNNNSVLMKKLEEAAIEAEGMKTMLKELGLKNEK